MLPQVPQKRARMMSSTSGRPPVGLHIDLPPPDLSQFKAPGEGPAQPPAPAQAQGQAGPSAAPAPAPPQQGPLFTSEVKEMFYYIRGAALKAAEIVRYQTDMKQLQRLNGQVAPVPKHLLGAFRQDKERLDQVCDVMEAQILRLMSVLVREINRQKAKAAEEAAAKAALEREQAEAAAAAAAATMALSSKAAPNESVKMEDMDMGTQPDGGQPSDTEKMPPPPEPNSSLAPPRVSSTAPSVVSLSNLPSSSADLSEAAATEQATKARLARGFNLKLDLSSPNLRGSFTGLVPNTAVPDPPASPVRLAPPKSAKPRTDDPTNAFGLIGQLNPSIIQQLSTQPSQTAFAPNNSLPFSGLADPSDTNALIPDILSSVNAATQQPLVAITQPDASLQALSADVIDLTGNSPVRGQMNMPINVDADGLTETIDLTMDSPTIPLSQFVAAKRGSTAEGGAGNEDGGSMTGIEIPSVGEGSAKAENATTDAQQTTETSAGPAPDASLEGLVSSLTGTGGEAPPTSGDVATTASTSLPTDATSLLATLTAQSSSNDNTANGAGASTDTNANVFQGLIPPGDFGDLGAMGLGGGDMGMDLGAMGMDMSMYLPSGDGTSGAGLGDASTAGIFDGFGGLMGDGGAGAGAGMDFDNMLGDMSIFAGMGGSAGDGSNTQNN
ncbi:hypothetical protein FRC01_002007 [Tulasnella sp. 417]|nr:hypothetical protein FRC01_002007 [Tulasnella sp. 417]